MEPLTTAKQTLRLSLSRPTSTVHVNSIPSGQLSDEFRTSVSNPKSFGPKVLIRNRKSRNRTSWYACHPVARTRLANLLFMKKG